MEWTRRKFRVVALWFQAKQKETLESYLQLDQVYFKTWLHRSSGGVSVGGLHGVTTIAVLDFFELFTFGVETRRTMASSLRLKFWYRHGYRFFHVADDCSSSGNYRLNNLTIGRPACMVPIMYGLKFFSCC